MGGGSCTQACSCVYVCVCVCGEGQERGCFQVTLPQSPELGTKEAPHRYLWSEWVQGLHVPVWKVGLTLLSQSVEQGIRRWWAGPEQLPPALSLPPHQPRGFLDRGWALDRACCYLHGPVQLPVSAAPG